MLTPFLHRQDREKSKTSKQRLCNINSFILSLNCKVRFQEIEIRQEKISREALPNFKGMYGTPQLAPYVEY